LSDGKTKELEAPQDYVCRTSEREPRHSKAKGKADEHKGRQAVSCKVLVGKPRSADFQDWRRACYPRCGGKEKKNGGTEKGNGDEREKWRDRNRRRA